MNRDLFAITKGDSFQKVFESFDVFASVDRESIGLPIGVRVLRGLRTKQDGAQLSDVFNEYYEFFGE